MLLLPKAVGVLPSRSRARAGLSFSVACGAHAIVVIVIVREIVMMMMTMMKVIMMIVIVVV